MGSFLDKKTLKRLSLFFFFLLVHGKIPFFLFAFSRIFQLFSERYFFILRLRGQQNMIIPVRCYSCGKVVGNLYGQYKDLLARDYTESEALDELGLVRYCCRRMVLTHIDLIDDLIPYSVPVVGTMQRITPAGPRN